MMSTFKTTRFGPWLALALAALFLATPAFAGGVKDEGVKASAQTAEIVEE